MKLPSWIKDALKELVPELLAEMFGIQGVKKLLRKKDEEKTEAKAGEKSPEKEKAEEAKIPHAGLLTLRDETRYFEMMSQLSKKEEVKISAFLGTLEPWERRKFRVAVGNSGQIIIPPQSAWISVKKSESDTELSLRKGDVSPKKETRIEYENKETKTGGSTKSRGIEFLKRFAKCTKVQMRAICQASGVLDSPINSIHRATKKIHTALQKNETEICTAITAATEKLKSYNGDKKYTGFWSAAFPKNKQPPASAEQVSVLAALKCSWPIYFVLFIIAFMTFWPLSIIATIIGLLAYGLIKLGKRSWSISFATLVIGLFVYGIICS